MKSRRLARVSEVVRVAGKTVGSVERIRRQPGLIEVSGIKVEDFYNEFVGTGGNALLVHN